MNAIYQLCWTTLGAAFAPLAATTCVSGPQLRAEESAFNRAAGAASTTEQSRRAAHSAGWDELTFDTKGEIIISSSGSQFRPENLTLFSPLLAHSFSLDLLGKFAFLRIRNSEKGANYATRGRVQEIQQVRPQDIPFDPQLFREHLRSFLGGELQTGLGR
jgi:hypothetical protein